MCFFIHFSSFGGVFFCVIQEPPIEGNMSLYGKSKDNPFVDSFPDPLCKLNLKETSEFVKSFPVPNGNAESRNFLDVSAQRREEGNNFVTQQRRLEAPSTPGRPVFSFTSIGRNLSRKSFPSKWDDAEKWLMSSSCHESPAHATAVKVSESSKISSTQCDDDSFNQQMECFSDKSRVTLTEERISKAAPNFRRSASLDHQNMFGAFNGVSCPTDIVLKGGITILITSNVDLFPCLSFLLHYFSIYYFQSTLSAIIIILHLFSLLSLLSSNLCIF